MNFSLSKIKDEDVLQFKKDMQEAFQKGFEDVYGKTDGLILPEKDIDSSLNEKGAIAYKAVLNGKMVGGAVVVIDETTQHNHLHLLIHLQLQLDYVFHHYKQIPNLTTQHQ